MKRLATPVVVIGAGPAGCVFATRMAQLGFDVCLIERARFPRARLGESLSPGVMPMLASMGAAAAVEAARFPRVHAVDTNWEGTETVRQDPRAQGMLVDRGVFDAALLATAAARAGVRVLQPAQVRRRVATNDGWRLFIETADGPVTLDAGFLADGSGRAARLGGHRRAMGPRTIAIHGYWTGARLPERPRIEAGAREWYWGVPIPDGSYNTLVFVDAARFRTEPGISLDARLRALLERSSLMRDTRDVALRASARATDATAYVDEDCVSDRHLKLGDAALALDPLSSSGVQKAIQTALSGAIVANTLLRRPEASEAALRFYRDSLSDAATRHRAWAAEHYATAAAWRPDPFWTSRASAAVATASVPASGTPVADDIPVELSPDARWEELPCLGAAYVELRSALRHPGVEGPVAYLGGHELSPLLRSLGPGMTLRTLAQAWSSTVPLDTGVSIARWLSSHGVVRPAR
ncbi:MAG TPA: tryptophan 7-halogenase [Polyangia bacterium]|jgi:flavin-dependent dehydrogenase